MTIPAVPATSAVPATPTNDFLSYASQANVNASFNPDLGRLTVNGLPVDINTAGLTYQGGQLTGTQESYDALLSPFTNAGAKTVDVYREMEEYQAYETPEEYRNLMLQLIARSNQKYQYDFDEDPGVAAAREELSRSISGLAAVHGFMYSGGTQNIIEAQLKSLTPQFEQAAYNRYKADLDQQLNFLNTLTKWDQIQYERSLDKLGLIKMKSNYILSLGEMEYRNFKLMLEQHRSQQEIELSKEKFELQRLQQDTENAFNRVNQLGYVDNKAASALGVPVGTKARWVQQLEMEYKNKVDIMAKENEYNLKFAEQQAKFEKELMAYKEEIGVAAKLKLMEREFSYQSSLADLKYVHQKELDAIAAAEKAAAEAAEAKEKAAAEAETGPTISWSDLKKQFTTKFDKDKDGYLDADMGYGASQWIMEQVGKGVSEKMLDQLIFTFDIPEYQKLAPKKPITTYSTGFKKKAGAVVPKQMGR